MAPSVETKLDIYYTMVLSQVWEQGLGRLIDENKAPAAYHPGRGSEGTEVGATKALRKDDYLLYDHRGVAHIIAKGVSLVSLFGDFLANDLGPTRGLGAGIVHFCDTSYGVLGQSGTLGGSQLIAAGAALSAKLRKTDQVAMCFFGDGAANRGTFHEAANAAGAWKLPLIMVVQNNGWAVSVPTSQSTGGRFVDRGIGYGMAAAEVDGQDPYAVYEAACEAVERARTGGGPTLIEAHTVRLQGHYFADPDNYRTATEKAGYRDKDPIVRTRLALLESGDATEKTLEDLESKAAEAVAEAIEAALKGNKPSPERLYDYIYA